jgi:YVTN family beta-propeller protein
MAFSMNMFRLFFIVIIISIVFSCKKKAVENPVPVETEYPKAYVVNGASNNVSIIDLNELSVKNVIQMTELGRFPHHINLAADGKKLAVALPEFDFLLGHEALHNTPNKKGGIIILNTNNGNTILKISLPNSNYNAVFTPDGKEVWSSTSSHTGEMYIFDAESGIQKNKVALGSDPSEVVFSEDGKYAFVALGESSFVYVLESISKKIFKTIKVDAFPTNVWAGADNKIYVENKNARSINIINANTLEVEDHLDLSFKPSQIAYNKALNELWVCQAGENKVAYFEKLNSLWNLKGTIITGDDAHAVTFTKDLKRAFVVNQKGNTVSVIDATSHTKTKDISVGSQPNGIVLKE